ncbi:hypothetical protein [Deinococcus petrolearius]|uniref:Uncharacterized protein n=1 Tax=Deinococcus petrolearius TaxID=1751295 RepID=A0ABW1DEK4_9DEIO
MPYPDQLTLSQARDSVARADAHTQTVLAMLAGDHWLLGLGWVGPRLPADNPLAGEFLEAVRVQFMPKNAVGEIARRHVGAVLGRYPSIKLALRDATAEPIEAEGAEMKAGEGALTAWLDRVGALQRLQQFGRDLLLGRAHLRSYVPTGQLRAGRVPSGDLLATIRRIGLMVPTPGTAQVVEDEETGVHYAIFRSRTRQGAEVAEVSYLNPQGQTVIRRLEAAASALILDASGDPAQLQGDKATDPLDLHGLLTVTEATREQFLTPTLVRNNWMLNFAKTAILRNAELAAVLERYGIGILPPGQYVKDLNAPGGLRFQPDASYRPGGANATFFTPNTFIDENGQVQVIGSGQYGRFEPVKPDALIATKQDAYHDMLDEGAQSHMRMAGDATASGESRIQAMNDFKTSLYATATAVEGALATHLEMVLALAAALSGNPGRFARYRVVVQCKILAAQPTVDERRQILEERNGGLRTTENAMSEIGVEDTDQMLAGVRAEQEEKLRQGQAAADALTKLLDPPKADGGG